VIDDGGDIAPSMSNHYNFNRIRIRSVNDEEVSNWPEKDRPVLRKVFTFVPRSWIFRERPQRLNKFD
jgi:hypothetical protein